MLLVMCSLVSLSSSLEIDSVCLADDSDLVSNEKLQNSFTNMFQQFNRTCSEPDCIQMIRPIDLYLIHDYSTLGSSLLTRSCERRNNYKMCRVTTKTKFNVNDMIGDGSSPIPGFEFNVKSYVIEKDKPVCFPPTCEDQDAYLVDSSPARCSPDGGALDLDCEVMSYEVDCPEDRMLETGNCDDATLPSTSSFFVQRTLYEATILAECAVAVQGGTSGTNNNTDSTRCNFGFGDVEGFYLANFQKFTTDDYYVYHDDLCKENGGRVCTAKLKGTITVPSDEVEAIVEKALTMSENLDFALSTYGSVTVEGELTALPVCLANSCTDAREIDALIVDRLESIMAEQGLPVKCERDSKNCNVTVSDISCAGRVMTSSPTSLSDVTATPTTSPTLTSTLSRTNTDGTETTSSPVSVPNTSPNVTTPTTLQVKDTGDSSSADTAAAGSAWTLVVATALLFSCQLLLFAL